MALEKETMVIYRYNAKKENWNRFDVNKVKRGRNNCFEKWNKRETRFQGNDSVQGKLYLYS